MVHRIQLEGKWDSKVQDGLIHAYRWLLAKLLGSLTGDFAPSSRSGRVSTEQAGGRGNLRI